MASYNDGDQRISNDFNEFYSMSFLPKELNIEEQKAIDELRKRMKGTLSTEMYNDTLLLYKFLKARNFRVNEAETMLQKHLVWRRIYQVDTIIEDFKPRKFFKKYVEPAAFGFDKEGSLVVYAASGKIQLKEVCKCVKKRNLLKHYLKYIESSKRYIEEHDAKNKIESKMLFTAILDLDKLTLANATDKDAVELFRILVNDYQNNYPETMKATYVINAPSYYVFMFAILKALMNNTILKKIHIYGYSGWKEKFLEIMDPDILPAFLGGNRTDPDGDPMCKSFVRHGGTIAPEYYLPHDERYFEKGSKVKTITVPNGEKREIKVGEQNVGSVIHWTFYCKSNIGFGLFRKTDSQQLEEVIPLIKYDTSDGTEKDSYRVRSNGIYIIFFDNTFSWINSKEVEYCIEVVNGES